MSGKTEQKRGVVNNPLPRGPTFLQDPRIHAMDGECVCGAKSCPQCGLSQICIQIPDNPENRSSNVKNVPRAAATAIIVNECRCEEFEAQIAWSRILALAAATGTAKTAEQAECEASQSGGSASERNAQTQSSTPDNKDKPNA